MRIISIFIGINIIEARAVSRLFWKLILIGSRIENTLLLIFEIQGLESLLGAENEKDPDKPKKCLVHTFRWTTPSIYVKLSTS